MELQLALDFVTVDQALDLIGQTENQIDLFEIGTPLLLREGVAAVSRIRRAFPKARLLADAKIVDGGYEEAQMLFEAGADIVTVLAVASRETLGAVKTAAAEAKGEIAADLIASTDQVDATKALVEAQVDIVCVHRASDSGAWRIEDSRVLSEISKMSPRPAIMVAGGIDLKTIPAILEIGPDIVVVGGSIVKSEDPEESARLIREALGLAALR